MDRSAGRGGGRASAHLVGALVGDAFVGELVGANVWPTFVGLRVGAFVGLVGAFVGALLGALVVGAFVGALPWCEALHARGCASEEKASRDIDIDGIRCTQASPGRA